MKTEMKSVNFTVRMTEKDVAKIKRICFRDELKPGVFAYAAIMDGVERLIEKQKIHGVQCMQPL